MYLLLAVAAILVVSCVLSLICFGNVFLAGFIDFPGALVLFALFIPMLIACGQWKDFCCGLSCALGKKKDMTLLDLQRAEYAIGIGMKLVLWCSVFLTLLQLLSILYQMSDLASLGPNLAVALLILLYGLVTDLLLLPIKSKLHIRIVEYMQ